MCWKKKTARIVFPILQIQASVVVNEEDYNKESSDNQAEKSAGSADEDVIWKSFDGQGENCIYMILRLPLTPLIVRWCCCVAHSHSQLLMKTVFFLMRKCF